MALARLRNWFKQVTASKDRFKKGDKPTQDVYEDLFESVPFFKETSDAATTVRQGLVELATDADASTRTTDNADGFEPVMQPHQQPRVTAGTGITIAETEPGNVYKNYEVTRDAVTPGSWVTIGAFTAGNTDDEFDDSYETSGGGLFYRITDTNFIEVRGSFKKNTGATADFNVCQLPDTAKPSKQVEVPVTYAYTNQGALVVKNGIAVVTTGVNCKVQLYSHDNWGVFPLAVADNAICSLHFNYSLT